MGNILYTALNGQTTVGCRLEPAPLHSSVSDTYRKALTKASSPQLDVRPRLSHYCDQLFNRQDMFATFNDFPASALMIDTGGELSKYSTYIESGEKLRAMTIRRVYWMYSSQDHER